MSFSVINPKKQTKKKYKNSGVAILSKIKVTTYPVVTAKFVFAVSALFIVVLMPRSLILLLQLDKIGHFRGFLEKY